MITFIVPNYFAYKALNSIIREFSRVDSECFSMLVVDAGGEEESFHKIETCNNSKIKVYYGLDSGIYNALNFGVEQVKTEYYLVLGVDDIFDFEKLDMISLALTTLKSDIFFLSIKKNNVIVNSIRPDRILSGPPGVFPSHTGGAIIRKSLHLDHGLYSESYQVLSDGLFVSKCLLDSRVRFALVGDVLCDVGAEGFSKRKELLAEYESMLIRNTLGQKKIISLLIYLIRCTKREVKMSFKYLGPRRR